MPAPTFAVNACFVRHGRVGGAEQATVNLLEGLRQVVPDEETWTVYDRERLVTRAALAPLHERTLPDVPRVNRMAYEPVALATVPRPSAWLHLNYATPAMLRAPAVTVIHDNQHTRFPENFSGLKRAWLTRAHAATMRRATSVIAISEFTAQELVKVHGSSYAAKIDVIPNAVSFDRLESDVELPAYISPQRPYLLSVAAHYRHKNLDTLLSAYELLAGRADVDLVLVGADRASLVGRASATRLDTAGAVPGVTFTGFVSDEELGALYRSAAAFVFPSLYEGFGLPVVEALGLGVPTITTRCAAIPEVGGNDPYYVDDPRSAAELADAILAVLADPYLARPSAARAAQVRADFAPTRIAEQYAQVLHRVAQR